jgi:hypothetical protein
MVNAAHARSKELGAELAASRSRLDFVVLTVLRLPILRMQRLNRF